MRAVLKTEGIDMFATTIRLNWTGLIAGTPGALRRSPLLGATLAVLLASCVGLWQAARAQGGAILSRGDAVVTGFSGIAPAPGPLPMGANPLDQFFIDPEGPSLQVLQLGAAGAPPQGQLIPAPAAFKARARDIGQVFAIAFDDAATPNVYVAATSAYGLHIVGPDGKRLKQGKAGAKWMPGQFGPGGGPGSVYKVDGQTGAVSLFANISGNGGAGLGDIVYNKASRHFYVSDLDTGSIHRVTADGAAVDSFDHGVTGRPAKALPAVADDGSKADIKSAAFSTEDPATWGYTANERLVWGLAIRGGRLYYAVAAGPQVWSVGLGADGSFAGDARWELDVAAPSGEQPSVISDMAFDGQGRLYLAQRGPQRGSYDYSLFAEPGQSAVLRYKRDATGTWVPAHEEYAVGLPPEHRSGAGGVALGYAHDAAGALKGGACNETLWLTGDRLRGGAQGVQPASGAPPEAADVHGLQGTALELVRPQNAPPLASYFVDYDGQFADPEKAGHVGDVEIWQPCEQQAALPPGPLAGLPSLPGSPLPPPSIGPPGTPLPPVGPPPAPLPPPQCAPGATCCAAGYWADLNGQCQPLCPSGATGGPSDYACMLGWNMDPVTYQTIAALNSNDPAQWAQLQQTLAQKGCVNGTAPNQQLLQQPSTAFFACLSSSVYTNGPCPVGYEMKTNPQLLNGTIAFCQESQQSQQCTQMGKYIGLGGQCQATPLCPSGGLSGTSFAFATSAPQQCCAGGALPVNGQCPAPSPPPPPQAQTSNLKIANALDHCWQNQGSSSCVFNVTVSNDAASPAAYSDPIVVKMNVPQGTTLMGLTTANWECTAQGGCKSKNNPVVLNPGASAPVLQVRYDVPDAVAKAPPFNCKLPSTARIIEAPGNTPKNTNDQDDGSLAAANLSGCSPTTGATTDLKIMVLESNQPACTKAGAGWLCKQFVAIKNMSATNTYNGGVVFVGALLSGVSATLPTECTGTAQAYSCTLSSSLTLNPLYNTGSNFSIEVPDAVAKALNCKLEHKAEITQPLGPPKNTDPTNDKDLLTWTLPACPQASMGGPHCPPGWQWTGSSCERRILVSHLTGPRPPVGPPPHAIGDPPPTIVGDPGKGCPTGQVASNGHCCPAGKHWANGRCVMQTATCSNGTRLIGGKCQCPQGTAWSERQDRCVAQTKTAETKSCPGNQVRVRGQCRCPDGTAWTGSRCEGRRQVKFDGPGQKGRPQWQAPGRKNQFTPLPNLNKGSGRRR